MLKRRKNRVSSLFLCTDKSIVEEIIKIQIDRGIQRRDQQETAKVFDKYAETVGSIRHIPVRNLRSALQELDILLPGKDQDIEQEIIEKLDANKNGKIERNEFIDAVLASCAPLEEWAKSWQLAQLLADSIPRLDDENGQSKDHLSILASLSDEHLGLVVSGFAYGLEKILKAECKKLREVLGKLQDTIENSKAEKFEVREMRCGKIEHFHEGLAARIGSS